MKNSKRRGVTLVELCIVLVLMSLVISVAISLLFISTSGFTATKQVLDVTMEDADFASRICSAIRRSGTSFTIPEQSFTVDKLTTGWNYLGLMHDVTIPAEISRTGHEIQSADALVYIEYAGSEEPASIPMNAVLLHNEDGYFTQTIIGHSYTDTYGTEHKYSLIFEPTEEGDRVAQTISYSFTSAIDNGEEADTETASIETVLQAINAIQVVYQGSPTNPAVAIAFRTDFIPTESVNSVTSDQVKGTVVMILDVSSSMKGTRISTLKETAKSFIEELSKNNELNILITVFSGYANKNTDFDTKICSRPLLTLSNAYNDRDQLIKTIDAIKTSQSTNLGDGLRVAYYELSKYPEIANYPIFLLVLTDGEVNACTCVKKKTSSYSSWWGGYTSTTYTEADFYYGDAVYNGSSFEDKYYSYANYNQSTMGRKYFQYFGRLINEQFAPKTYLISMYNGMSSGDKKALEEVFDDTEAFDASSLTQFTEVFSQINHNISAAMWAFEGPRL